MTINESIASCWIAWQSESTCKLLKLRNAKIEYNSSTQSIELTLDYLEHAIELVEGKHLTEAGMTLQIRTGRLDCLRPDIQWQDDRKSIHVIDHVWMDARGSLCLRFSEQQRKIHAKRFLMDQFAEKLKVGGRKVRIYYGDELLSPYPLIYDWNGGISINFDYYPG